MNIGRANGAGDHLLITFHGIPAQYVADGDPYQRKCQATAQALVTKLGLNEGQLDAEFPVARGPRRMAASPTPKPSCASWRERGVKRLDAICPGFAVDCLETIDEIGHEGDVLFRAHGGETLRYIPALNSVRRRSVAGATRRISLCRPDPGNYLNLLGRFLEIASGHGQTRMSAWESYQQLGFAPAEHRRHLVT